MDATEKALLRIYKTAYAIYMQSPSYANAAEVLRTASALVQISDDYQEYLDEADDIMSEPV